MFYRFSAVSTILLLMTAGLLLISCSGGSPILPPEGEVAISGEGSALTGLTQDNSEFIEDLPVVPRPLEGKDAYAPGEVLVVLQDGVVPHGPDGRPLPIAAAQATQFLDNHGLRIKRVIPLSWGTVYRLEILDGVTVLDKVDELSALPEIEIVEPNYRVQFCEAPYFPNDPLWENPNDHDDDPRSTVFEQFGPSKIGASVAWNYTKGSQDVVVCIIDTGVQVWHEDLEDTMWVNTGEIPDNGIDDDENGYIDDINGWDMDHNHADITDYGEEGSSYHGTACAGVVAAAQDNGLGCTGIAPGCRIMGIRIGFNTAFASAVIEGTEYAKDNGASVISMSFITSSNSTIMRTTMQDAHDAGVVLVAGAGNWDATYVLYPCSWDFVVKVGATSPFGPRWAYAPIDEVRISQAGGFGWGSTYGNGVEVMGFGEHYITTHGQNDHKYWDGKSDLFFGGTSNATPMVAAAFALLKSHIPGQTSDWYRERMWQTADDLHEAGYDIETGYGRINLIRAFYGSDRYASEEDPEGFVDVEPHDGAVFDSLHHVSSGDYGDYVDTEDLYKITAPEDGTLVVLLDIFTWGEDLDIAIYDDSSLTPESLVDESVGENHALTSNEVSYVDCQAGETFYIRITAGGMGDSTAYGLDAKVVEDYFSLETGTYDPGFIHQSGSNILLGRLDFETGTRLTINELITSVRGTMPAEKITRIRLYRDTNLNGTFQRWQDTLVSEGDFNDTNRAVFTGFEEEIDFTQNPTRFFITVNISGVTQDAEFELVLTSYKDISTVEGKEIYYRNFPKSIGPFEVGVDITPPTWDTTIGIQYTHAVWEGAVLKWNSASDDQTPPVDYNVYWTTELPFDFGAAEHADDVTTVEDDDFDHAWEASGLVGGVEHYIAVRAQDQAGNEDDNIVYLAVTPLLDETPPTWDTTVGIQKIEPLHHGAVLWWNSASDEMTEPVEFNVYWTQVLPFEFSTAYHEDAVESWESTDYDHKWHLDGLDNDEEFFVAVRAEDQAGNEEENTEYLAVTPTMAGNVHMPIVLGSMDTINAWEVVVDPPNQRVFVADSDGGVLLIDVSDPTNPSLIKQVPGNDIYGVDFDGTLVYAAGISGLSVIDPDAPGGAAVIGTASFSYALDVCVVGDWVYVTNFFDDLLPVDVSVPESPQKYPTVDSGNYGYGMDAQDGYLYVATNEQPRVYDLSIPSAPAFQTTFGGSGAYEVDAIGDRVYVTYWQGRRVSIYSLADPADPVWLNSWTSNSGYGGSDIVYLNDHLYFATNNHYIEVLNVDDPGNIFKVGQVSTDGPDGLDTDGVFIYSAENQHGLKVII